ncbi:AT-hook motif nuclear-localized protein 19 [Striga asiatica]|uniref:AT-hook motif nuclear-localized protein 19 n=1 Tax=Striga asiatica TaxID=4170 RepID=A0A5A7QM77_STRAF|nr:AT-hook motif nuclear-localized protein 19 [Striga asiatica]
MDPGTLPPFPDMGQLAAGSASIRCASNPDIVMFCDKWGRVVFAFCLARHKVRCDGGGQRVRRHKSFSAFTTHRRQEVCILSAIRTVANITLDLRSTPCSAPSSPPSAPPAALRLNLLSLKAAGDTDGGEEGAEHGVDLKSRVMLATVRIALRMQTSRLRCVVKAEKLL